MAAATPVMGATIGVALFGQNKSDLKTCSSTEGLRPTLVHFSCVLQ